MLAIKGHFDGKVIVPDEPVNFTRGQQLLIRVEPLGPSPVGTARDLLKSRLLGLWKYRTDISDSLEFAQELRREAERRRH